MQNSENQEQKKEQQRSHRQLIDIIAQVLEEVRKLRFTPLEASQSHEQLLPVSLRYCSLRGCTKLNAPQPQVVEVDGQLGQDSQEDVPQVLLSPRSKAADCECF